MGVDIAAKQGAKDERQYQCGLHDVRIRCDTDTRPRFRAPATRLDRYGCRHETADLR